MKTKTYSQIKDVWPQFGRHILARYDDSTVVVYQAFCPEIAKYAVEHGRFGGPKYSFERMTWIKTNFLWMMYRAGWATKKHQEHILAITLKREGFDEILRTASEAKKSVDGKEVKDVNSGDDVRLQWDPDHHPSGAKLIRRAIQLGLRRDILKRFHAEWVVKIEDVTEFVHEQHKQVIDKDWDNLLVPEENVYVPEDERIRHHIRLDIVSEGQKDTGHDGDCVEGATGGRDTLPGTQLGRLEFHERYDAVLCLGGAFNPVHSRHIQVMTEVKAWLEENTGYRIVAGLLAVAPDGYVRNKCRNQKCIKSDHRIQLCRIACEHIDWLNPFEKPIGSAQESGSKFVRRQDGTRITIIVIVGADRAINKSGHAKWRTESKGGMVTVCIGRQGETELVRKSYEKDLGEDKVKNSRFYLIPKELDNVSSTDVRKKLEEIQTNDGHDKKAEIITETVRRGWLYENVGQYILENHEDLYLS